MDEKANFQLMNYFSFIGISKSSGISFEAFSSSL